MFCPTCKSEYRDEIKRCESCDVDLVPALLEDHPDLDLQPVLRTNNQGLLAAFKAALGGAKIPYIVRGEEAASLMPTNATVVVPREHLADAKELLRVLDAPVEGDAD